MMKTTLRTALACILFLMFITTACFSCVAEAGEMKTVIDCSGADVQISTNIQRVICTQPAFTTFMIAMGEGDKLIGAHGSVLGQSWAPYFYDNITSVELYGYKPEPELIYAADADLVVVKNAAYAETLRKEGIPAIYFGYNNLDELYYGLDLMAEIFGADAKNYVEKWKARVDATVTEIADEVSVLDDSQKRNVYYINAAANPSESDLFTTFGGNSFVDCWIKMIGAHLVTSDFDGIESIDPEVILAINPDTIVIGGYAEYTRKDELLTDPVWGDVSAVQNNEIYLLPTGLVTYDRFAVDLPILLDYSANLLYPSLHEFEGISEMKEFYQEFYGIEFDDEALTNMLLCLNPDGTKMN